MAKGYAMGMLISTHTAVFTSQSSAELLIHRDRAVQAACAAIVGLVLAGGALSAFDRILDCLVVAGGAGSALELVEGLDTCLSGV